MKKAFAAAALLALSMPAAAQWSMSGLYAGFGAGQAQTGRELVTNRENTITNVVPGSIRTEFDDKDSTWKAFVGYRLSDWLSVEGSYAHLGEHSTDTRFRGGDPASDAQVIITREVKGFGIDAVLSAPITRAFGVFGRIGAFRADLDATAQLGGNAVFTGGQGETFRAASQRETITRYGAGLDWSFAANLGARLEWERYEKVGKKFEVGTSGTTGEADMDNVTLSVVYRFR